MVKAAGTLQKRGRLPGEVQRLSADTALYCYGHTSTQALSGCGLHGFALKQALPAFCLCTAHTHQDQMQSDLTLSLKKPICAHLNCLNRACQVLCKQPVLDNTKTLIWMCCVHINILFLLKSPYIGLQLPATQVQAYMAQLTMILLVCFKVSYLILIPCMSFLLRDIKGISKNNSLDSLSRHSTGQPREMVYELPGYGWMEIACIV